jgi:hypothetical protein
MPRYATRPTITAQVHDHELRLRRLEIAMATRVYSGTTPPPTPVWDVTPMTNPDFEGGLTGWAAGTGPGVLHLDVSAPIAGTRSARMDEPAFGATRLRWVGTNNTTDPRVGVDVFHTAPADIWRISARVKVTTPVSGMAVGVVAGATPADCYTGTGAWLQADSQPVGVGVTLTLSGQVTIPAGRNYVTFEARPSGPTGGAWSWWIDTVAMQRKLQ